MQIKKKYPFPKLKKGKLKMYILEMRLNIALNFNPNQQVWLNHY